MEVMLLDIFASLVTLLAGVKGPIFMAMGFRAIDEGNSYQ